ncbi:DUF5675 family protein [Maridesulfovibrio sp.]|uniref:DUF5675 family protein n=1 Tax=Maridesulfovibrio sp. TaxID=2795000 RepID=UPI0029CA6AF7|nr:DUF5675 family protein [Maridesulfovibrio sp.]
MKQVELRRVEQSETETIGVLVVDGKAVCWCLEEPWRDNEPAISCIPAGVYVFALEYSPSKGRELWTIKEVPKRDYVRVHIGNTVDDTEGCPLTGKEPGEMNGKRAVLRSAKAFGEFMTAMGDGEAVAQITVINVDGSMGEKAEDEPKPKMPTKAEAKKAKEAAQEQEGGE